MSTALLFLSFFKLAMADLPVHCEMTSVVGEWQFWVTNPNDPQFAPTLPLSMTGTNFCLASVGQATMNSDLMRAGRLAPQPTTGYVQSFTVGLALTQKVHMRGTSEDYNRHELVALEGTEEGQWSMIFDEGFEVRIGTRSYLAISRYTCSSGTPDAWCQANTDAHENTDGSVSGWDSLCGQTFVGWYHDTDSVTGEVTGLGCWFGTRTDGPAPAYLLTPVEVSSSFSQQKQRRTSLRQTALGIDSVANACDIDEGVEDMNVDAIPTNFTWTDKYLNIAWQSPITIQGDCGSCYAVAAVYALQSRANLLLASEGINEPIQLSTQSVVSCSWYNQGCSGGLEMLVHRHAQEAGIPPASCMPYTSGSSGQTGACDASCFVDQSELLFAKDYGYVGGFNGQCSEARLLRNLYEFGPLTIAVNVANARVGSLDGMPGAQAAGRGDSDTIAIKLTGNSMAAVLGELTTASTVFPFLSGYPFETNDADSVGYLFLRASLIKHDMPSFVQILKDVLVQKNRVGIVMTDAFTLGMHGWEYIDHSIVLVGFGVNADGSKYWSIRNSWGGYSEYGAYTNLDRGDDIGAIESGAVWVTPDPCKGKLAKILTAHGKYNKYCTAPGSQ